MAWKKITPNIWYNSDTGTEIIIKSQSNGYAVVYSNRITKSSSKTYKTGRTFEEAVEEAKKFMEENN